VFTTIVLTVAAIAAAVLWRMGRREHAAALTARAHLLDEALTLFPSGSIALAADGFPVLTAAQPGGRQLVLSLIADTLVTRRLPQLWLKLTLREPTRTRDFSLGALARPTGSEFYALTHDLPDFIAPPGEHALLLRGRDLPAGGAGEIAPALSRLFADPALKEVAATPAGLRVIRQACQGERSSHVLLRQARFAISSVSAETIRLALNDAEQLDASLRPARLLPAAAA